MQHPESNPGESSSADEPATTDAGKELVAFSTQSKLLEIATRRVPITIALAVVLTATFCAFQIWVLANNNWRTNPELFELISLSGAKLPTKMGAQPWRYITANLLHLNVVHLAVNMFVLVEIGRNVERLMGTAAYAFTLFLCAVVSVGASQLLVEGASLGASGLAVGVLAAGGVTAVRRKDTMPAGAAMRVGIAAAVWCAAFTLSGLFVSGVDTAMHAGGCLAGALAAALVPKRPPAGFSQNVNKLAAFGVFGLAAVIVTSLGAMAQEFRVCTPSDATFEACYSDFIEQPEDSESSEDAETTSDEPPTEDSADEAESEVEAASDNESDSDP